MATEYVTKDDFGKFLQLYFKDRKNSETYNKREMARLNELVEHISYMGESFEKLQTYIQPGGGKAVPSFYQPALNVTGDVAIYPNLMTGRPEKSTIKSNNSNVDFVFGEYDLLGLGGDFFGIGALSSGWLAGEGDAKANYNKISSNSKLSEVLSNNQYGLSVFLKERVENQIQDLTELKREIEYSTEVNIPEGCANIHEGYSYKPIHNVEVHYNDKNETRNGKFSFKV